MTSSTEAARCRYGCGAPVTPGEPRGCVVCAPKHRKPRAPRAKRVTWNAKAQATGFLAQREVPLWDDDGDALGTVELKAGVAMFKPSGQPLTSHEIRRVLSEMRALERWG